MDGSPVVFQRWDEDQPRFLNNDEHCVVMTTSMGEYFIINNSHYILSNDLSEDLICCMVYMKLHIVFAEIII